MGRVFRDIDRQNRHDNFSAMQTLRKQGIQFIRPAPAKLQEWHARSAAVTRELVDGPGFSSKFMALFNRHLDAFRSENPKPR
jgi:hypothetical protein